MRVLLVEDNPGDARLVCEMVREVDAPRVEIVVASRLDEARAVAAEEAFDAVLLDLELPDASGLEDVASAAPVLWRLPVVVLTGRDDPAVEVEALRQGAQDYLVKGRLDGPLLLKTLRFAVERKRVQTADHVLAETGRFLAGTMDYGETLRRIGQAAVRSLADFCVFDLVGEGGVLQRLHVAHADERRAALAERLAAFPLDRTRPHLSSVVAKRRRPVLVSRVEPADLEASAQSAEHLALLRELRLRSYIAVPLVARGELLGVVMLLSSRRSYEAADLALAERMAGAAALAIDNAALYSNAQEALRSRDRVLAVVAHDLRNPLGVITMCAELLLGETLDPEQRLRQLQIVRRSAERMEHLIQDLLDVARIEAGRLVLETTHLDPGDLVQEAVELNAAIADARSLELRGEVPAGSGAVLADRERVQRVLANLVGNAMRFTPAGGTIVVRAEPMQGEAAVCVSVSDTGAGVAAEELPNLFLPFWQSQRGNGGGAGLGLAIVRGIVEAHGGRIWAESTPGKGTTLSFTLPLAPERRAGAAGEPQLD